jgi:hypothetical protein
MNSQKFAKILLSVSVGCMLLLCAGMFLAPLVDSGDWYVEMIYGLIGISLTSAACLLLAVKCDTKNKLIVKTPRLPLTVLLWGMVIAFFSFCTMWQTAPLSPVSQSLRLFTIAILACSAVLAVLLRLTTEHKPEVNLRLVK